MNRYGLKGNGIKETRKKARTLFDRLETIAGLVQENPRCGCLPSLLFPQHDSGHKTHGHGCARQSDWPLARPQGINRKETRSRARPRGLSRCKRKLKAYNACGRHDVWAVVKRHAIQDPDVEISDFVLPLRSLYQTA
jgi:hypothetical protein